MQAPPSIVILAGPNGAGKSTTAAWLLRGLLGLETFVNADVIARELAPDHPEEAAVEAGRRVLTQLQELTAARASFAMETTLAGRAYAPWLRRCVASGYEVRLVFLWLPSADAAVERVARRVRTGGHSIPEEVIRRRYPLGIRNFMRLYRHIATSWELYASVDQPPRLIARGPTLEVVDQATWSRIEQQAEEDG